MKVYIQCIVNILHTPISSAMFSHRVHPYLLANFVRAESSSAFHFDTLIFGCRAFRHANWQLFAERVPLNCNEQIYKYIGTRHLK